jgi:photosystem II stability/assembly factor-like uncharacterized protein
MIKQHVHSKVILAIAILLMATSSPFSQSWKPQTSGTANILEAVWFKDAQNGWAVGNSGTVRFTANSGQTWSSVNLTNDDLKDVAFLDQLTGLIVGDNGRIFRTTNGGANWTQVPSGTSSNIIAVAFGEGGMDYAAGRDGVILRSTNSGTTWAVVETGTTRYRGIIAKGTQNSWVVGEGGKLKITTDGGVNWIEKSSGTLSDLHDVFFINTTEGWIAGQNDVLRYSNDGGNTWASRNNGITAGLEAVYFLNSNEGWVVGNSGSIFKTVNGGLNWTTESSGTTNELNDVFFLNAANGWTVGDNGVILYRNIATGISDNVNLSGVPEKFGLEQNYPNPFWSQAPSRSARGLETVIRFALPRMAQVKLEIYNLRGQRVRVLVNDQFAAGYHTAEWNGRDESGRLLASGVYLYRLTANEFTMTQPMLLIK